jgi:diaminohydroxyphosphoribosylaminopyrimidine deaminase/5-amino-6-(5-phosphoribosylamino)uracil reductase
MVGSETVRSDDPLLNTRLPDGSGRDPLRVVVDSELKITPGCRMLMQQSTAGTLIATTSSDGEKIAALEAAGAEIIHFRSDAGKVPLRQLWQELGRRNVQYLLLEGGAGLATAALEDNLIDQLVLFIAPKIVGGCSGFGIFSGVGCSKMADAINLHNVSHRSSGDDLMIVGDIAPCLPD